MNKQLPTFNQWKKLYKTAIKFQRMECWNWMWDTDLFGVQNPENGEGRSSFRFYFRLSFSKT